MELRRILLRVLLGSLAVAALSGVGAMVLYQQDVIPRLIGSALLTAGAAGLMIGLSFLADWRHGRLAGLVGMGIVVIEFLLSLLMVWVFDGAQVASEMAAIVMATFAGEFVPILFFLILTTFPRSRLTGWTGVISGAAVFLLVIIPTVVIAPPTIAENWFSTAACVGCFGVIVAASVANVGFDRRHWRFLGAFLAVVAAATAISGIWSKIGEKYDSPQLAHFLILMATITSFAAFIAHTNLVVLCPLKPGQRWVKLATICASALTAILAIIATVFQKNDTTSAWPRAAASTGILAACGSLALLTLAALNRKPAQKPVMAKISQYTLICPGCNQPQLLPVGDTQCPGCLMGIHVRFDEPHCPKCNYLLYMLTADRCPECGTVVRPSRPLQDSAPAPGLPPAPLPAAGI